MQINLYSKDKNLTNNLQKITSELVDKMQLPISIQIIDNLEFLYNFKNNELIYIIDIDDSNTKILSSILNVFYNNPLIKFIVITNNENIYHLLHKLDQIDLLLKPIDINKFKHDLYKTLQITTKNKKFIILDKYPNCKILLSSILYIEKNNRLVAFHTTNGIYFSSNSLKFWENKLLQYGFIKIYRSILVNFLHIIDFNKQFVYITNNTKLPISRRLYKNFYNQISSK